MIKIRKFVRITFFFTSKNNFFWNVTKNSDKNKKLDIFFDDESKNKMPLHHHYIWPDLNSKPDPWGIID